MPDPQIALGPALFEHGAALLAAPPAFLDHLPLGAYACDVSGKVRWFNRRAAELWGRSPEIGANAERYCGSHKLFSLSGEPIARGETPMAEVLRTGISVSGKEASVERPDGSRIVCMVHISPLKDEGNNIVGAINCFHDITEVRREDRKLRERERQFRDLLDALPAAIYTTDAKGRITYFNEAAVELSGRRPTLGADEWCVTWRLFWPDGTPLPHDQCPMAIALKEERAVRGYEAVAERPDGSRVPFIPFPTPLHDAGGRLVGAVNMLVDISHRKEAETVQRVLYAELNHRIKNNIQMLHGLLKASHRETHSAEARTTLSEAIQRVGAIGAAQTVLYRENNAAQFDCADFIAAVCAAAKQTIGQNVDLHCEAAPALLLHNDVAVPLALILNELITNAAKYGLNDRGDVSIRVRLTQDADGFNLSVEDSGPGFEFSEARKRSSGLGLVQGLVRQIGGQFAVERAPGARCIVRFPAARHGGAN
jgi:PAS domain S-box-containing protein